MKILDHANQEVDSIRRINIAISIPKDLHAPLTKDMSISSDQLFSDDINATIKNIKAQQKVSEIDKTYFKPESTFDREDYFSIQYIKNWGDLRRTPENKGYKDKQTKQSCKKVRNQKRRNKYEET